LADYTNLSIIDVGDVSADLWSVLREDADVGVSVFRVSFV